MKNKIITNTLIFIFIILFVNLFKTIFGPGNVLIGVTIITMALVLMEVDLTITPVGNFFKILFLNLFSLIFSVLSIQNVWIGIILNFIGLFTIGYLLSGNLKKSMVIPFGLQYFFMIFYPVEGSDLINRFLALIAGTIFIMIIQFIVNKDKIIKTGTKVINNISNNILIKIIAIQKNESFGKENFAISESINYLKRVIYDKRVDNYYLTKDGILTTDILWALERINLLLDNISELENRSDYSDLLNDVYSEVEIIKDRNLSLEDIDKIKSHINNQKVRYEYVNEFVDIMTILYKKVESIDIIDNKEKNNIRKECEVPHHFHKRFVHKSNLKIDSAKVRYAIRLAIVGSITVFIAKLFNLSEGRWMCFTIFSLIQPYSEVSNSRVKDRVIATIIGGIIVLISFSVIRNQTARSAIILLAGYSDSFSRNYREKMICVTVSAVASAAMAGGTIDLVVKRILFVMIGASLTVIANKFIFPYKIDDMKKYLIETYNSLIKQMKYDIKETHNDYSVRNLYLITGFIDDKMKLSMELAKEEKNSFIVKNRIRVSDIYKSLVNIKN
ncbi:MAG: FUSC family protein [Clostridium sp.]|uniref:FUSC family protein n=1 Tax=Clostridium sp. TaxID=1506 RepID=UPI00290D0819|nr:FUSC family protein [Clostridium sp.]MDU5109477.1 FUSC family protein [Clostridium sp.]